MDIKFSSLGGIDYAFSASSSGGLTMYEFQGTFEQPVLASMVSYLCSVCLHLFLTLNL